MAEASERPPWEQEQEVPPWEKEASQDSPAASGERPPWEAEDTQEDQYRPFGQVPDSIDPADLRQHQDWIRASKQVFRHLEGHPFEGDDEEVAEWGLDGLGKFNWNLVQTGYIAKNIIDSPQETQEAFLYLMDTYDNTEYSWEGAGRAVAGIVTDPTTYAGIGTLGAGLAARQGVKVGTKEGVRAMLKQAMGRSGIPAAIEGAAYMAADNSIRQGVEVAAGRKDGLDVSELLTNTGIGAAGGLGLGTGLDMAGTAVADGAKQVFRRGADEAPEVSRVPEKPELPQQDAPVDSLRERPSLPQAGEERPAQKLRGRREEDVDPDLVLPDARPDELVLAQADDTGLRSTPASMEELDQAAEPVVRSLKTMDPVELEEGLEVLRRGDTPLEKSRVIMRGVHKYTDELKTERADLLRDVHDGSLDLNSEAWVSAKARLDEIEETIGPLEMADEAFSSLTGSLLRQRKEGLTDLRGVSVETLMDKEGLTREAAEVRYIEAVDAARLSAEGQKVQAVYDRSIESALNAGDLDEAARLATLRHKELDTLVGMDPKDTAGVWRKINEAAIGNVFSAKTIMVNMVPSTAKGLVAPAVRGAVSDPLQLATRKEMSAAYSGMRSAFGSAWEAAKASWRYEQSILTRRNTANLPVDKAMERVDSGRFLEEGLAIRGMKGGLIRFFPRVINASDEFLSQIFYAGEVAGRAAHDATASAQQQGLSGKGLDDFVKRAVEEASDSAFKVEDANELLQPIINKGVNRGYSGERLLEYVRKEARRNPRALRRGSSKEAIDYVDELLYKRPFSEENQASRLAKKVEETLKDVPALKTLTGLLFFRTPVRVFEEVVRLTPGLQYAAPRFLKDLRGVNGSLRQTRAKGEAMTSIAFAGAVASLYGRGAVTGSGEYDDWRQRQLRGDTDLPPPYTITLPDGSTWNYRNLDPVAGPLKIMVNAMENMDRLAVREAQGEFVGAKSHEKLAAEFGVGLMAVAEAVKDANLTAGVSGTMEALTQPSDVAEESQLIRYLGEKLELTVPNTLRKMAKTADPTIKDPATFWQTFENSTQVFNFDSVKTPYAYDALGRVRTISDTGQLHSLFSSASQEDRERGRGEKELEVMRELDRLGREVGAIFRPPYTHSMTGNLDFRSVVTEDGEETLYDRWNRHYRELEPWKALHPIVTSELPDGTFKHKGARVEEIRNVIKQYREAAFGKLLDQEERIILEHMRGAVTEAESEAGFWDFGR